MVFFLLVYVAKLCETMKDKAFKMRCQVRKEGLPGVHRFVSKTIQKQKKSKARIQMLRANILLLRRQIDLEEANMNDAWEFQMFLLEEQERITEGGAQTNDIYDLHLDN